MQDLLHPVRELNPANLWVICDVSNELLAVGKTVLGGDEGVDGDGVATSNDLGFGHDASSAGGKMRELSLATDVDGMSSKTRGNAQLLPCWGIDTSRITTFSNASGSMNICNVLE